MNETAIGAALIAGAIAYAVVDKAQPAKKTPEGETPPPKNEENSAPE